MENKKKFTPYAGECPARRDTSAQAALWYNWNEQTRMAAVNPSNDKGKNDVGLNLDAGITIAEKRKLALSKEYNPRFQQHLMKKISFLGSGSYGKVWRVKFPTTPEVAVKQIPSHEYAEELWKERDFLIKLKNSRITNLLGAFFEGELYLVFELCYCSLVNIMDNLSEENRIRFTLQLAEAMVWIHSNNIIHCDIKPDNVLLTSSNNLVLSDFGSAILLENSLDAIVPPGYRGVFGYQDYEANVERLYSKASDMFSFGCVVFEIWTNKYLLKYPFKTVEVTEYCRAFREGRVVKMKFKQKPWDKATRMPLKERANKIGRLAILITGLVAERPHRLTAEQVLYHKDIDSERKILVTNGWNLDDGKDTVTKRILWEDRSQRFQLKQFSSMEMEAAYRGIYYDQQEDSLKHDNLTKTYGHDYKSLETSGMDILSDGLFGITLGDSFGNNGKKVLQIKDELRLLSATCDNQVHETELRNSKMADSSPKVTLKNMKSHVSPPDILHGSLSPTALENLFFVAPSQPAVSFSSQKREVFPPPTDAAMSICTNDDMKLSPVYSAPSLVYHEIPATLQVNASYVSSRLKNARRNLWPTSPVFSEGKATCDYSNPPLVKRRKHGKSNKQSVERNKSELQKETSPNYNITDAGDDDYMYEERDAFYCQYCGSYWFTEDECITHIKKCELKTKKR